MVVASENSKRSEQSNLIKSTTLPSSEDKISGADEIDPKPPILFNSTVYIAGCTRGYLLAGYLPALLANLDTVTSLWADWRLVDILYESNYRHNLTTGRYRTERISLEPYYDYWAARYESYDENIVKAEDTTGTSFELPAWKRYFAHMKYFGVKVLDTSPLLYLLLPGVLSFQRLGRIQAQLHTALLILVGAG
eukprot:gene36201-47074_t